ncbi:MAG: histidine kinase [Micropruina sp.]|uniref:sensor histidine kinase n=1 Tax=Micropruina sp. TaxID=2737536 RepID=UPI0039E4C27A
MSWSRPLSATLVVGAALGGAALGSRTGGTAEIFFLTAMGAVLGAAAVTAGRSVTRAAAARTVIRATGQATAEEFVERLIASERERLGADVERELRVRLTEIVALASNSGADLGAAAVQVHTATRAATTELRRQLGLLRQAESAADEPNPEPVPTRSRTDLLLGIGATLLALAETLAYPVLGGEAPSPGRILATLVIAPTVLLRRVSTGAAAVLFGGLWLGGALLAAPPYGGLWMLLSVGPIAFTLGRRGGWAGFACWAFLVGAVAGGMLLADPENLPLNTAAPVLAGLIGLAARHADRVAAHARSAELSRRDEVQEPLQQGFAATRDQLARDVHDTVSHAIGVIAVHAGAAELAWPERPELARHSLDVIVTTARAALAELPQAGERTVAESPAELFARFRQAGLAVVVQSDPVPAEHDALVSRMIQECLTNVLRHAGATRAEVSIGVTTDEVTVSVRDDGTGAGPASGGFGLVGIRERVAFAGGSVSAGPAAGGGFQVLARVPLVRQP